MIFIKTITNSDVEYIIKDNFKYRKERKIRTGDISWRCRTTEKNCVASLQNNERNSAFQRHPRSKIC